MAANTPPSETVVDIPGVGRVAFPADMSEDEISDVIRNKILPTSEPEPRPRERTSNMDSGRPPTAAALRSTEIGNRPGNNPNLPAMRNDPSLVGEAQHTDPRTRPTVPQRVRSAVTGHGRIPEGSEDMGSFEARDASTEQQIQLAAGYLMSGDPQQRVEMIRDILGDEAKIEQDSMGNTIVRFGNETAFLNRPGFGPNDALDLASEITLFAPAARMARWLGKTVGWSGRIGGGGAAAGTTEAVRQQGATTLGAERVDKFKVGLTAAFGGAAEGMTGMVQRFTPEALAAIRRVRDVYGIDLKGSPHSQVQDVAGYASRNSPSRPGVTEGRPIYERGTPYDDLQVEILSQRRIERGQAGARFAEARSNNTAIFRPTEVNRMKAEYLDEMEVRGVNSRSLGEAETFLNDLDELVANGGLGIDIRAMERWRKQVSTSARLANEAYENSGVRGHEALSLGRLVKKYDDWIQGQYIDDMISGDPRAVEMWRGARHDWQRVMDRFDDDEVVRDIIFGRNATPEQMREWLFGVSTTQSPARAGETVRRLNTIFGRDSEIMGRVQADFMLDIIDPLLRDTPNLPAFLDNFKNLIQTRPTLARQLFTPEEMLEWEQLAAFVRGVRTRPGADITMMPQDFMGKLSGFAVRMTIGHGIAKGGARVALGTGILDRLRVSSVGRLGRRQILEEVLGVYPLQPLVPHGSGTVYGSMAAGRYAQREPEVDPPDNQ